MNRVLHRLIVGLALFTIFANDLDNEAECNLSKFAYDTKLDGSGWFTRSLRVKTADWRDVLLCTSCRRNVLNLVRKNSLLQTVDCLESIFTEKALEVLFGPESAMCPCSMKANSSWLHYVKCCQQIKGSHSSPLLSPGEVIPGCLVWVPLTQQ